ncbi:MAG TPA: glycosyltransferase [Candidatus Paceibacterota bacterium]|jgi:glycosyltransferase involved in cell wall biosynthesis|nr:glycosyltransferase [Candidatus Paceibacterota bacterium]
MAKTKVVVVINGFLVGGAERLSADILSRIDRSRFDVSLVTLFQFNDRPTMYHLLPSEVAVHKLNFGGFADVASWIQLARVLRQERPAVVLSNLFFSNTVVRALGCCLGYRSIAVEHNTYTNRTRMQLLCDRLLAHVSAHIVAVSPVVKEFTAKREGISLDKFVVIPNGIDVEAIARRAAEADIAGVRAELGLSAGAQLVVSVGRMAPQKNFGLLIEAFAEFSKSHPAYHLAILGDGGLMGEMKERVARLGLGDVVHLLGNRKDVVPYLAAAQFFVSASSIEGLSIAQLEALACGLPLLATHTASSEALVKPGVNGQFIQEASVQAVCDGLAYMIGQDMASMRLAAQETARVHDIRTVVSRYEALIEEVAR